MRNKDVFFCSNSFFVSKSIAVCGIGLFIFLYEFSNDTLMSWGVIILMVLLELILIGSLLFRIDYFLKINELGFFWRSSSWKQKVVHVDEIQKVRLAFPSDDLRLYLFLKNGHWEIIGSECFANKRRELIVFLKKMEKTREGFQFENWCE